MIKRFLWIVFLASGVQASWGFALIGPPGNGGDSWQTAVIGYNLAYTDESSPTTPGGPVFLGDIGGPKNIGEEYRRNARTIYYAYDANFLGFFGTDGATAADGAFAIMNSLTNVTSYDNNLSGFPLNSQHFNYLAQTLFLTDVKSVTLHLLLEQMGLAEPERFTWTLAERFLPPGGRCPVDELYLVLQRNFDFSPTALNQLQYSSYVNDVLYSYLISEACTGPNPLAITVPFSVDPLAQEYTSVAANDGDGFGGVQFNFGGGLQVGGFYTGLTRDDVAGLRYLLQTNNVNFENTAAGSLLQNPGQTNVIQNFNLGAFLAASLTNDAATVATLFPNVVTAGSSNYFTIVCTPNIGSYLQNPPVGSPVGTPQQFVITTNGTTCVPQTNFVYNLANVITVTNAFTISAGAFLQTVSLANQIGAPIGSSPVTNITLTPIALPNVPPGDFFIVPPGLCGFNINTNPYILNGPVTATTNLLTTATNASGFVFSQSIVTYFTNHYYLAQPVICTTNGTGLYQGVDNIKFVRANFDSLLGQYWQPITNIYTMVLVTNSQAVVQTFQRVVTQPDILLSANDFIGANTFNGSVSRNINFDTGNVLPGLAGPGVINSPATFNYNKIGDAFRNGSLAEFGLTTNNFLSQLTQQPTTAWASFDSSTNDPVVYPNGTSIQNLENQILVRISPTSLPGGTSGVLYPTQTFTASGGSFSPPFTWSATGLPSGLTLVSNPDSSATLSGTPTQSGTFDIVIKLTDSLSRTVQWNYSITIP